jgi:hypothetical protein
MEEGNRMGFYEDAQLAALRIERMVFHLVGPKENDFVRLEEVHPGRFAEFFLGRIRAVNAGAEYRFSVPSTTRECLVRIDADPARFQEESEELASAFQRLHGGAAARGAFLIFVLRADRERTFALLKYDDETVLRYELREGAEGRKRVELEALERTFVQNPGALQKSALIRLTATAGDLVVMDRVMQPKVAQYFETFLSATRLFDDAELTHRLVQVTRDLIRTHRELVSPEVYSQMTERTFDAAAARGVVDADAPGRFLAAVLGQPLRDDDPLLQKFTGGLRRARLDGMPITLDPARVSRPTVLRLVTASNIQISVPMEVRDLVVVEDGRIIINDAVERSYDDTDHAR